MSSGFSSLENQFSKTSPGDLAVIGDPIEHSLSPLMHNAALSDWWSTFGKDQISKKQPRYHAIHVKKEEVQDALKLARKYQMKGLNVTVPHKETVVPFLPFLDEFSQECGAVNTIDLNGVETKGFNTDGFGFDMSLRRGLHFDPLGKTVLILGAGGTGKMMLRQLCLSGIKKAFLWNRSADRSASVVRDLKKKLDISLVETKLEMSVALTTSDVVINATSVGLKEKDGLPAPDLRFSSSQLYFDVIYHRMTPFLSAAKNAGAKACGGLGMLLFQGARSFEIWTKSAAPLKVMKKALMDAIKEKGLNSLCQYDI